MKQGLAFKTMERTLRALADYHHHSVIGWENLPRKGGFVLATNHSFATYDAWLLAVPLYDDLDRLPQTIADRLILRTPLVGDVFRDLGFVEATRESAVSILDSGNILGVAPGGMREALRSSRDKYRVDWAGRVGFVWAAMKAGVPIVLGACPRADDIFDIADIGLTRRVYDRFKVPLALFRGRGPTLLPRPVKLTHVISEPIHSDVPPERVTKADVEAHHKRICERMDRLMKEAAS